MEELILATHNQNKVNEARSILTNKSLLSLNDIDFTTEIPETGSTLFENALIKVTTIFKATGRACIADDTGLEVNFLGGDPGVYSARYAGENADSSQNIAKLLRDLEGVEDRSATFRTILAFMSDFGQYRFFEGTVKGFITEAPVGSSGFGYDSVFKPEGYENTFAEMSIDLKNQISHRKRALSEFQKFSEISMAV